MSSVRFILAAMQLLKRLKNELINMATYIKNQTLSINGITFSKLGYHVCSNYIHSGSGWISSLNANTKEKRAKLGICLWQGFSVRYEDSNQHWVYDPHNKKVYITQNLFVDEHYLYYQKSFNDRDHSEDNWAQTDDAQFANINDFENPKAAYAWIADHSFHILEDNILEK